MLDSHPKKVDLLVLIGLAVFAVVTSYATQATFLFSALLFLGLPSAYLLFRSRTKKKEAFVGTLIFGVLYCFLLDYMAELNHAWYWQPDQLIFQNKIFGVVTPDAIIWTALWVLLVILFYEHFIDKDRKDRVSKRSWVVLVIGLILFATILWLQASDPGRLKVEYAYLIFGFCSIVTLFYVMWNKPSILPKISKAALYFIPLYLVYEIVGRSLDQWHFPGNYVGGIVIGPVGFPLEEFLFWIVLSSIVVIGGYELFIDDYK